MIPPRVCVAGTFDGLHAGHLALLSRAFAVGPPVLIGLTSDTYVVTYKHSSVRPYGERKEALTSWLETSGYLERSSIISIGDPYEPASSSVELDTIVVSEESRIRAGEINGKRTAAGLPPLHVVVVPMVYADDRKPISARRIRSGEIDARGRLMLPDSLRGELAVPLGRVLDGNGLVRSLADTGAGGESVVVSVGDLTTKTILDAGICPILMVVDNKVNRMPYHDLGPVFREHAFPVERVKSGPGYISAEAQESIRRLLGGISPEPTVLEVDGEEDLLVLSVISAMPLGGRVYYGQPRIPSLTPGPIMEGVVEAVVTESLKGKVGMLLSRFTVRQP